MASGGGLCVLHALSSTKEIQTLRRKCLCIPVATDLFCLQDSGDSVEETVLVRLIYCEYSHLVHAQTV